MDSSKASYIIMEKSPTLFIICGLPGSGKTTYAKQIERKENALRLCPDEWMSRLTVDGFDESKRSEVESIMQEIAERCLYLGINVILEFGFWAKEERDQMRALAKRAHAKTKLCYQEVSRKELLKRLKKRNIEKPEHTFVVNKNQLDSWISLFQAPTKKELELW